MAQYTLPDTIQTVVAELSKIDQTNTVLSSNDNNVLKLLALTNAALDDLTNEYDWQFLQQRETLTTTPNQEAYSFPSDYARIINGTLFDVSNPWEIKVVTPTMWEIINIWNVTASPFAHLRVFNNKLNFFPVPVSTYNFVYDYISENCILDGNTGEPKSAFTLDSDIIMFDSRLMINLIKYKYLASIGSDTTDALAQYMRTLALKQGQDKPAPKLSLLPQTPRLISTANIPDGNWTV